MDPEPKVNLAIELGNSLDCKARSCLRKKEREGRWEEGRGERGREKEERRAREERREAEGRARI